MNDFDFFECGYYITEIPSEFQPTLWQLIYTTEWVVKENTKHLQYDIEYAKVPKWHPEITGVVRNDHYNGSKSISDHPTELSEVGISILEKDIFKVLKQYRNISLKYCTMWNGSANLDWHSDINDGADITVLMYLTEEQTWDTDWGGTIELRKQTRENLFRHYTSEHPISGKMIIMNNTNPLMQHKVKSMINRSVNRYTFNFGYSWT